MSSQTVDVLAALKAMVKGNALSVTASNNLAGDPAPGTTKQLSVVYTLGGVGLHQMVTEGQSLTIPGQGETPGPLALVSATYGVLPAASPLVSKPALPTTQDFEIAAPGGTITQAAVTFWEEGACWPNVLLTATAKGTLRGTVPNPLPGFVVAPSGVLVTGLRDGKHFTEYHSLTLLGPAKTT